MALTVLIMGAAGCGKSTVGEQLANRLNCAFLDADALHDSTSKARMAAGIALTDIERQPWLDAVHAVLEDHQREGRDLVFACSALKRSYRQRLRQNIGQPWTIFLDGDPELLARRVARRPGHFFAPSLLDDQLRILEPPTGADCLHVDVSESPARIVERIIEWLEQQAPQH